MSETDAHEAHEVGERAAELALSADVDGSVVIVREKDYNIDYKLVDLKEVAAKTKKMPEEFFVSDNMISEKFIKYAQPLVGELSRVERL